MHKTSKSFKILLSFGLLWSASGSAVVLSQADLKTIAQLKNIAESLTSVTEGYQNQLGAVSFTQDLTQLEKRTQAISYLDHLKDLPSLVDSEQTEKSFKEKRATRKEKWSKFRHSWSIKVAQAEVKVDNSRAKSVRGSNPSERTSFLQSLARPMRELATLGSELNVRIDALWNTIQVVGLISINGRAMTTEIFLIEEENKLFLFTKALTLLSQGLSKLHGISSQVADLLDSGATVESHAESDDSNLVCENCGKLHLNAFLRLLS